jgi:DNA (cytosine-5)-methyltransferase 1
VTHIDLFSGIGGFALACRWAGIETVQFVEIDPFCQKVLAKNFPGVPIHDDINTFKWTGSAPFLLTAGFPCQPFSIAGSKRGQHDCRNMWPQTYETIRNVGPRFVLLENVPNILNDGYAQQIFGALAKSGYRVEWDCVPANIYGAHFIGERLWIVASPTSSRGLRWEGIWSPAVGANKWRRDEFERLVQLEIRDGVPAGKNNRISDGIPNRMDRLKSLGNAIVPQVAYQIIKAIVEISSKARRAGA